MEIVISFLVAVAAGVTCHLICKWLDSHNKDNEQPSGCSTTEIKREEPSHVLVVHTGVRSLFTWNIVISFFAYWHYIICNFSLQYTQYTFLRCFCLYDIYSSSLFVLYCDLYETYEIVRILASFSKSVRQICVLLVCYASKSTTFYKILKISGIRKTPENQGFPGF